MPNWKLTSKSTQTTKTTDSEISASYLTTRFKKLINDGNVIELAEFYRTHKSVIKTNFINDPSTPSQKVFNPLEYAAKKGKHQIVDFLAGKFKSEQSLLDNALEDLVLEDGYKEYKKTSEDIQYKSDELARLSSQAQAKDTEIAQQQNEKTKLETQLREAYVKQAKAINDLNANHGSALSDAQTDHETEKKRLEEEYNVLIAAIDRDTSDDDFNNWSKNSFNASQPPLNTNNPEYNSAAKRLSSKYDKINTEKTSKDKEIQDLEDEIQKTQISHGSASELNKPALKTLIDSLNTEKTSKEQELESYLTEQVNEFNGLKESVFKEFEKIKEDKIKQDYESRFRYPKFQPFLSTKKEVEDLKSQIAAKDQEIKTTVDDLKTLAKQVTDAQEEIAGYQQKQEKYKPYEKMAESLIGYGAKNDNTNLSTVHQNLTSGSKKEEKEEISRNKLEEKRQARKAEKDAQAANISRRINSLRDQRDSGIAKWENDKETEEQNRQDKAEDRSNKYNKIAKYIALATMTLILFTIFGVGTGIEMGNADPTILKTFDSLSGLHPVYKASIIIGTLGTIASGVSYAIGRIGDTGESPLAKIAQITPLMETPEQKKEKELEKITKKYDEKFVINALNILGIRPNKETRDNLKKTCTGDLTDDKDELAKIAINSLDIEDTETKKALTTNLASVLGGSNPKPESLINELQNVIKGSVPAQKLYAPKIKGEQSTASHGLPSRSL